MNSIPLKSLSFYGLTFAFVLVLFKVVTLYGETGLHASPPIGGTYRLTASSASPCLSGSSQLKIEQSGIYLLGTLVGDGKPVPLEGRFQGDRFHLTGRSKTCPDPIAIEATATGKTLSGTLQGNPPIPLTFQKEAIESGESAVGGH